MAFRIQAFGNGARALITDESTGNVWTYHSESGVRPAGSTDLRHFMQTHGFTEIVHLTIAEAPPFSEFVREQLTAWQAWRARQRALG